MGYSLFVGVHRRPPQQGHDASMDTNGGACVSSGMCVYVYVCVCMCNVHMRLCCVWVLIVRERRRKFSGEA
jgi:hypothetical protein